MTPLRTWIHTLAFCAAAIGAVQAVDHSARTLRHGHLASAQTTTTNKKCKLVQSRCRNGVTFISDIEGDGHYWAAWKERATAEGIITAATNPQLTPGWCLVSGGDTVDKGLASLTVVRELLHLKKTAPQRVCLILGNRDLNKVRYHAELDKNRLAPTLRASLHPWAGFNDADTCEKWRETTDKAGKQPNIEEDCAEDASFLRWMQEKSMGAKGDFKLRRSELSRASSADATDEEVYQSYVDSMKHSGCEDGKLACNGGMGVMYSYLRHGQLMAVSLIHRSIFVHGGITGKNLMKLWPAQWSDGPSADATSLRDWEHKLWTWKEAQLDQLTVENDFTCAEVSDGDSKNYCGGRPASLLADFALPNNAHGKDGLNPRTNGASGWDNIVNVRASKANEPRGEDQKAFTNIAQNYFDDESVKTALKSANIDYIVVGHTPRGPIPDVAAPVNIGEDEAPHLLTTINGDCSCNRPHHHIRDKSDNALPALITMVAPSGTSGEVPQWVVDGFYFDEKLGKIHYRQSADILFNAPSNGKPSPIDDPKPGITTSYRGVVVDANGQTTNQYLLATHGGKNDGKPDFSFSFSLSAPAATASHDAPPEEGYQTSVNF